MFIFNGHLRNIAMAYLSFLDSARTAVLQDRSGSQIQFACQKTWENTDLLVHCLVLHRLYRHVFLEIQQVEKKERYCGGIPWRKIPILF